MKTKLLVLLFVILSIVSFFFERRACMGRLLGVRMDMELEAIYCRVGVGMAPVTYIQKQR